MAYDRTKCFRFTDSPRQASTESGASKVIARRSLPVTSQLQQHSGRSESRAKKKTTKHAPASTNSLSARQQLIMADVGTAHFLRKPARESSRKPSELQWLFMQARRNIVTVKLKHGLGQATDGSTPSHCVRSQHETKSSLDLHLTPTPTTHNRN